MKQILISVLAVLLFVSGCARQETIEIMQEESADKAFSLPVTLKGTVTTSNIDAELASRIVSPLKAVSVKLYKKAATGSDPLVKEVLTNTSGAFSFSATSTDSYYLIITLDSEYATLKYDNGSGFTAYTYRYEIGFAKSTAYSVVLTDNPYAFHMSNTADCYYYAKSGGIFTVAGTSVNKKVSVLVQESGAWFDGAINVGRNVHKGALAHEYGHFLLSLRSTGGGDNSHFTYPDGYTDSDGYSPHPLALLSEGWAEFFSAAVLYSLYEPLYKVTNFAQKIELNYGGVDIFLTSTSAGGNYVGIDPGDDGKTYYIYTYEFPRFHREASLLFDLWDTNKYALRQSGNIFGISDGRDGNSRWSLPSWERLSKITFTNTAYKNYGKFTYQDAVSREATLDKTAVSIDKIYKAITIDASDSSKDLVARLTRNVSSLWITGTSLNNVILLHSSYGKIK